MHICLLFIIALNLILAIINQNWGAVIGFIMAFLGWLQVYFLLEETKNTDKE